MCRGGCACACGCVCRQFQTVDFGVGADTSRRSTLAWAWLGAGAGAGVGGRRQKRVKIGELCGLAVALGGQVQVQVQVGWWLPHVGWWWMVPSPSIPSPIAPASSLSRPRLSLCSLAVRFRHSPPYSPRARHSPPYSRSSFTTPISHSRALPHHHMHRSLFSRTHNTPVPYPAPTPLFSPFDAQAGNPATSPSRLSYW